MFSALSTLLRRAPPSLAVVSLPLRTIRAKPRAVVALIRDVPGLGAAGQKVAVKAGFARNVLTNGLKRSAVYTNASAKDVAATASASAATIEQGKEAVRARLEQQMVKKLESSSIKIKRQLGNEWEVTAANIAEKAQKQLRLALRPENVQLKDPIRKEYGTKLIPIVLDGGSRVSVKVDIVQR